MIVILPVGAGMMVTGAATVWLYKKIHEVRFLLYAFHLVSILGI